MFTNLDLSGEVEFWHQFPGGVMLTINNEGIRRHDLGVPLASVDLPVLRRRQTFGHRNLCQRIRR